MTVAPLLFGVLLSVVLLIVEAMKPREVLFIRIENRTDHLLTVEV